MISDVAIGIQPQHYGKPVPPDLTSELSFDAPTTSCVDALLQYRVAVIKGVLWPNPARYEQGVLEAYHGARFRMSHLRAASRLVSWAGYEDTRFSKTVRPPDVRVDPLNLPRHMRSAQPAIDGLLAVHSNLTLDSRLRERYSNLETNLALFNLSNRQRPTEAFVPHQDNQGVTGLGVSGQLRRTLWRIYGPVTHPCAPQTLPIAFEFHTDPGDAVVLMEREGARPITVPYREGETLVYPDGSPVHGGLKGDAIPRPQVTLFTEETTA